MYAKKEEFENSGKKNMNFVAINESNVTLGQLFSHLHDGKLHITKISQRAVHWIHIHESPFSILEEEGFNMMMKEAFPECKKTSRQNEKINRMQANDVERRTSIGSFHSFLQRNIKDKFDKFWSECNLLMSATAMLDARLKIVAIELTFSSFEMGSYTTNSRGSEVRSHVQYDVIDLMNSLAIIATQKAIQPSKPYLDLHFEEGRYTTTTIEALSFNYELRV
ncbi:hypothetical protein Cgig2_029225 [Carnegiea gigantea]|uniref:hAT-like transposase RNase-H fold domain-containing protein n=1 Tax=Carnegiea gigantea TaxID=171969 RepID=A0A9Q1GNF1_9CARY|nr:hypothetical protein Cgig2_029225 [Carnegiea gigantea]